KDAYSAMVDAKIEVMVKDPGNVAEMYPNPVSDYLNIRTGELKNTVVRIYSSGGKIVMEKESLVGAFKPLKIDLRDFAPGMYRVNVLTEDDECTKTIVKL
ncbi:MAG: T9SS type A sorting domain-containing protein, partial [Candidatus Cryptobacteroides sp.]